MGFVKFIILALVASMTFAQPQGVTTEPGGTLVYFSKRLNVWTPNDAVATLGEPISKAESANSTTYSYPDPNYAKATIELTFTGPNRMLAHITLKGDDQVYKHPPTPKGKYKLTVLRNGNKEYAYDYGDQLLTLTLDRHSRVLSVAVTGQELVK